MDLRGYYRRLREIESGITTEYVVVKSLATPDGGIAGRLTEVTRALAAKMVVDGMAESASASETAEFRRQSATEKEQEEKRRASAQIQFAVVTSADVAALERARRGRGKK